MTREELLRELAEERFGNPRDLERERPPTPFQIMQRRRVLIGRDAAHTAALDDTEESK